MKLSPEIKELIGKSGPGLVATSGKSGMPNVSPKGSFRVLDDEHVVFGDMKSPRTLANLRENPQVSVICIKDRAGVRIWGKAEILNSGPLFEQFEKEWAARSMKVNNIVKIAVEDAVAFGV